ncbi:MAG: hypothetical protein LBN94_01755 [Puniceicoccales bacterium]|jgi:hypothetical protein|nr:hypothetical protein [Puniceicoccales bacterium]
MDFGAIEVKNPRKKFPRPDCLSINRFMVKADLFSLFNPEVVVDEIILDVDKIVYDRSETGDINLELLSKAFVSSKKEHPQTSKGNVVSAKKDTPKQKIFAKTAPNVKSDAGPLKLTLIDGECHFMVRKMTVHLGHLELYNFPTKGAHRNINIDATWNFTNVHSRQEISDVIIAHLQGYGIALIIQNVLATIFDLPGVKSVKRSVKKVSHFGQRLIKGVVKTFSQTEKGVKTKMKEIVSGMGDLDRPQLDLEFLKNLGENNNLGDSSKKQ